jgi:hypothetical protein
VSEVSGNLALTPATDLVDISRAERNDLLLAALRAGVFDFVDFGSHQGASLRYGSKFGGKLGLGIELDDRKSVALLKQGLYVLSQDLFLLPELPKSVDFAVCSHVLEHLANEATIFLTLQRLSRMCRKFVIVEQPDFSSELYLFHEGLKMVHSAMETHHCHIQTRDLVTMLWSLDLGRFILGAKFRIRDSSNPWLHRADAKPPLWTWDEIKHPPKPTVAFDRELFRDIALVIGCSEDADIEGIAAKMNIEKIIMRSYSALL